MLKLKQKKYRKGIQASIAELILVSIAILITISAMWFLVSKVNVIQEEEAIRQPLPVIVTSVKYSRSDGLIVVLYAKNDGNEPYVINNVDVIGGSFSASKTLDIIIEPGDIRKIVIDNWDTVSGVIDSGIIGSSVNVRIVSKDLGVMSHTLTITG